MHDSNLSKTPAENNPKLVKATEGEQLLQETLYGFYSWISVVHSEAN